MPVAGFDAQVVPYPLVGCALLYKQSLLCADWLPAVQAPYPFVEYWRAFSFWHMAVLCLFSGTVVEYDLSDWQIKCFSGTVSFRWGQFLGFRADWQRWRSS